MSKFVEKVQRSHKVAIPQMGFHKAAETSENPAMVLVADITRLTAKLTKDIISSGVDALIVNSTGLEVSSLNKLNKNGGDIPLGLLWNNSNTITIAEYVKAGIDFVIFDINTTVETVNKQDLGKFLKVDSSLLPGMVKAINDLTLLVDGVLITNPGSAVTIETLLVCKFFSDLLNKPLLFAANSILSYSELESLHNSGVNVILLPVSISVADIADMTKSILKLPRNVKKKTSMIAVLPGISSGTTTPAPEEPEEEDDDDI